MSGRGGASEPGQLMSSGAVDRFVASMAIGYEQWHDGVGYDVSALSGLTEDEKRRIEDVLVPRAQNDWRDLEALERLDTPRSRDAIVAARHAVDHEIRLYAHLYGPEPSEAEREAAVIYALKRTAHFAGMSLTMRCAVETPTPAVVDELWNQVRDPSRETAYHAAEALCRIRGVTTDDDGAHRALFLKLVGPASPERDRAVAELEQLCGA